MKYIEELKPGDLFLLKNDRFILTSDYKISSENRQKRLSINVRSGFLQWIDGGEAVEIADLYFRDTDGNIIALKEIKNEYSEKTPNLL